jgi:outer membrane protein assembly factor BamB
MKRTAACLCWLVLGGLAVMAGPARAADWPQFMRSSEHTGDAADEELKLPLGLVAQVKLDDAVMTSPAVVGGLAYVVDQMGTAYCVDPKAGRIVWKASPDAEKAMGFNTSSPCVAKGRIYYGTVAGAFHILDCKDGKVVKTLALGSPVISPPTLANDSVYFQALDGVIRCLDLDGGEKWTWDHFKRCQDEITKRRAGFPGGGNTQQYGGGEVTVSGTRVVTSIGWDLVCLEDKGKDAELTWCQYAPSARQGAPMSSAISGEWIYTCRVDADGALALSATALKDGAVSKEAAGTFESVRPSIWNTPTVRGAQVVARHSFDQPSLYEIGKKGRTMLYGGSRKGGTLAIGSCALAKDHLVVTTLWGEAVIADLAPKPKGQPFVFRTASGRGVGSSPAVSGGCVFFGGDDGCLYVLGPSATLRAASGMTSSGPDGTLQPRKEEAPLVSEPRSRLAPATGKSYGWNAAAGNQQGTSFADDPDLKPPLRVRWATRAFGHFKTPVCATEDGDVISVTLSRTVTCQEQATGRLRWRLRLPPDIGVCDGSAGVLVAGGRVYVPAPFHGSDRKGALYCLDQKTGQVAWSAEIGGGGNDYSVWARPAPVLADGKVAFGFTPKDTRQAVAQAWDAATGAPAWKVELNAPKGISFGVTDGKVFYFSSAPQYNGNRGGAGETAAIEAATGKVLWRTADVASGLQLALRDGRLYLYDKALVCLSAKDGSVAWQGYSMQYNARYLSVGSDCLTLRGYGGGAVRCGLADGKPLAFKDRGAELGGAGHSCGPVTLTPNLSVNATAVGLHVRDVKTGALLWLSPGFAPRGCVNPSIANGRVFWPGAASGVIYCWEPEK